MSDTTCPCFGSGFIRSDDKVLICVSHLKEAYLEALNNRDMEMAAVIVMKSRGKV